MINSKQVLVMKKFPKDRHMRHGKYCSQAGHAAVGALLSIGHVDECSDNFVIPMHDIFIRDWLLGSFTKITVYVDTDEELISIYDSAKLLGIPASLIKDNGLTEFNRVPTLTAVGLGPSATAKIDTLTGHLPLF